MTDEAAMLAAIISEPADDTARLAFADWLQENAIDRACAAGCGISLAGYNTVFDPSLRRYVKCPRCSGTGRVDDGRSARAEFIRVQVELMRAPPCGREKCDCKTHQLSRRESELWDIEPRSLDWAKETVWSRGFVSALSCSWSSWREHADQITRAQPIERVRLTDLPYHFTAEHEGEWQDYDWGTPASLLLFPRLAAIRWPRIVFELPAEREPVAHVEPGAADDPAVWPTGAYR